MEVAIIGAGMAGLSAAITLEKSGVTPVIFEKRSEVGDRFINAEAMFSILNRPINDSLPYLEDNYGIKLTPVDRVKKLVVHSKKEVGSIEGEIGYINVRGRHKDSYEKQLEKQVKSKIQFNSTIEYAEICKKFDKIILATGDGEDAAKLGNYRCDLTCTIKGVTVEGDFSTEISHVWFNYDIIPKGYGWVIPFSNKTANLVLAYPDYPNNIKLDLSDMWDQFFELVEGELNQTFKIVDDFEISRYMMGICQKPRIDNTYFVGNCFGALIPGLGFGQFASVLTGIYSAFDICKIGVYEEQVKGLFDTYNNSLVLRRYLENLDNNQLDNFVKNLDNKFIDDFINKICGNRMRFDFLKAMTPFMRMYNEFSHKR